MDKRTKKNIILIGFMGSGKTSVGKVLAKQLSYHFHDTDQLLEQRAEDTISNIFATQGEEYFRNMETDLLKEMLPKLDKTVLSTGGGLPLRKQNVKLLKEMGYVVFLKASKQTTIKRLTGDKTRPLLQGGELEQKLERMLEIRTPIYEKAAHRIILTDDKSIEDVAAKIVDAYQKQIEE